ncbi:MAG: hypothetical protein QM697_10995 [Lachnospiraceae bacterium]
MGFIQVTAAQLRKRAEELKGLNMRFKSQVESLTACEQRFEDNVGGTSQ